MGFVLGPFSAFSFYRKADGRLVANILDSLGAVKEGDELEWLARRIDLGEVESLKRSYPGVFPDPVQVIVGGASFRSRSQTVASTVSHATYPTGSFVLLPEGHLLPSPALTILGLAGKLPLFKVAECACELCGSYRKDQSDPRGMRDEPAVLTSAGLRAYLDGVISARGLRAAREAAAFVADGSGSPMETIAMLLLSLSVRRGGAGLPKPEMNAAIEIPAGFRRLAGKSYVKADLLWRREKVIVEYDSDWAHGNPRALNSDAARRNALQGMGYTVISLTRSQLSEWGGFCEFARVVLLALRRREPRVTKDWTECRLRIWANRLNDESL